MRAVWFTGLAALRTRGRADKFSGFNVIPQRAIGSAGGRSRLRLWLVVRLLLRLNLAGVRAKLPAQVITTPLLSTTMGCRQPKALIDSAHLATALSPSVPHASRKPHSCSFRPATAGRARFGLRTSALRLPGDFGSILLSPLRAAGAQRFTAILRIITASRARQKPISRPGHRLFPLRAHAALVALAAGAGRLTRHRLQYPCRRRGARSGRDALAVRQWRAPAVAVMDKGGEILLAKIYRPASVAILEILWKML